jgi:predicted anti-sigma-YlaC factor YlaD
MMLLLAQLTGVTQLHAAAAADEHHENGNECRGAYVSTAYMYVVVVTLQTDKHARRAATVAAFRRR